MESIDSAKYLSLLKGGLANLSLHEEEVNDLNVFPIPDGDTGKNMRMTYEGGIREVVDIDEPISDFSKKLGDGMLLSARGNSGVILSQFFAGMEKGFEGETLINTTNIKTAFNEGVKKAYSAVINPVEGTILTVIREASESANSSQIESLEDFFSVWLESANRSLLNTTNLLKELKEANVIDSGGAGIVYIIDGIYKTLLGKEISENEIKYQDKEIDLNLFTSDMKLEFGYCTEVLVRLQKNKCDVENFDINIFIDYLKTIGNSIVCFKTGSIVKVHVHTFTPYKVLEFAQRYGEFLTVKIENMMLQNEAKKEKQVKVQERQRVEYATVAVSNGDGIKEAFEDFGVDYIIEGGQTRNPSTNDFITAFREVNANNIFVFPNNSNVILACQNAKDLYKDSNVIIIPTKNLGEGFATLAMIDYNFESVKEIEDNFKEELESIDTILISKAVRDANLNGIDIKKDDYIAISNGEVLSSDYNPLGPIIKSLENKDLSNYFVLYIIEGNNKVNYYLDPLIEAIKDKFHLEVETIYGGQDVYNFILILE